MSPRAFERPATITLPQPAGEPGLALEGLHIASSDEPLGGAVIAPPHPLYGGSMESPVVTELADACSHTGWDSLRFNWRGVGASGGEITGDESLATEDYRAALAFMLESVDAPLVACGYSFGGAAAVRAARNSPRVKRLLLVAPPPSMLDRDALAEFRGSILIAVGEQDTLADPDELESLAEAHNDASFASIPETDHFFLRGLSVLRRVAIDWLGAPTSR